VIARQSLDILLPVDDMNLGFSAEIVPLPTPGA
jgi:hypothetical protein